MKILKIGGGIIAPKGGKPRFHRDVLDDMISQFRDDPPNILIHGAGAYGHGPASELPDRNNIAPEDAVVIGRAVDRLSDLVLDALAARGFDHTLIPPDRLFRFNEGRTLSASGRKALEEGGLMTRGDVVMENDRYRIYSGDEAALDLVRNLDGVEIVVFATSVPGVLDQKGRIIDIVCAPPALSEGVGDVTGNMHGKVLMGLEISKRGPVVRIVSGIDGVSVRKALRGDMAGTLVVFR